MKSINKSFIFISSSLLQNIYALFAYSQCFCVASRMRVEKYLLYSNRFLFDTFYRLGIGRGRRASCNMLTMMLKQCNSTRLRTTAAEIAFLDFQPEEWKRKISNNENICPSFVSLHPLNGVVLFGVQTMLSVGGRVWDFIHVGHWLKQQRASLFKRISTKCSHSNFQFNLGEVVSRRFRLGFRQKQPSRA